MKNFCLISLLLLTQSIFGQASQTANDTLSARVLPYNDYLQIVMMNHPVAISAGLVVERADMQLRSARGGFDPLIYGDFGAKQFDDKFYYQYRQAGVEIPTWMGVKFHGGFESTDGQFLNPEANMPAGGLLHAGLSVDLGAGLLMDNRRAAFRQAQIAQEQSDAQRDDLLNQLYAEATRAYFNWWLTDQKLKVAEEAVKLANDRYEFVRQSFKWGEFPAIDTVEAYTQVLNRYFALREAQTQWARAVQIANIYLWTEDGNMAFLSPEVRPDWSQNMMPEWTPDEFQVQLEHPRLRMIRAQRDHINITRRLAAEYLRPTIQLKYNFLSQNVLENPQTDFFQDRLTFRENYTVGAALRFPLFVRDARGRVGMARVDIERVDLDFLETRAELEARVNAGLVELNNLADQVGFFVQNVSYLQALLEGEQELFNMGESSLFLVNARETSLITGQNVLLEVKAQQMTRYAEIRQLSGRGFSQ